LRRLRLCLLLLALPFVVLASACAEEARAPGESTPVATNGGNDSGPLPTLSNEPQTVGIVSEGVVLSARLFGPQNDVAVILAHMRPNDKSAWLGFAEELGNAGYAALAFDFSGHGESQGDKDTDKLDENLTAVLNYLRGPPFNKRTIFLVGASMGGTTSLVVAAREDVAGVVAVSAPSQFEEQDALSVVNEVRKPKLFIAADEVEADMVSLDELFQAAAEPKEREVYPGKFHGTELLDSPSSSAFRERIIRFLRENS